MPIKHTLGRGSKTGPMESRTMVSMPAHMILANCVHPPTVCWIMLRDKDAANGMQDKKDPSRFPAPCQHVPFNLQSIGPTPHDLV